MKKKLLPRLYKDDRKHPHLWLINGQYLVGVKDAPYAVCFGSNASSSPFNFLVYQSLNDFWSINNDYKFTKVV